MTAECRPPAEHDAEPWHWVLTPEGTEPMSWDHRRWERAGYASEWRPQRAFDLGWRWLAVARAPAPAETPIPEPAAGQVWRSPKPRVRDRVVVHVPNETCVVFQCGGARGTLHPSEWRAWAQKSGARPE